MQYGAFVISLDFELLWGVRDNRTIADYGANILGVRQVVPALLDLFAERNIACTWATVGLLFFDTNAAMRAALPARKPRYKDARLSSYNYLDEVGADEERDPYYYGLSLIKRILDHPAQEIGTHTFSHFYCLEEGGDVEAFRADLEAARSAAARLGIKLASIVFPRNQVDPAHLSVCREFGLRAFRGNERVWFHRARSRSEQTLLVRASRLADSHLPIGGPHDHEPMLVDGMVDIPASRFLRPARKRDALERLRLWRITSAMETAARHRKLFHLWWHPHNFGADLQANLAFLRAILDHFRTLQERYDMRSMTMAAVADKSCMRADSRLVLRCERENANKDWLSNSPWAFIEQEHNARRSISVDMNPDEKWSRRRAVEVHDETADGFFAEYRGDSLFDSPFRYGRHLIDRAWERCLSELPAGGTCLDIGCGVGAYMARLLDRGFRVTGIEPSAEMRRLATQTIPADLVHDGSVLQLPSPNSSLDFVYAIEVFRYLDTRDNAQGHREIVRVLKPGGIYFGTYVNKWALDGFRQLSQFRKLAERLSGTPRRYHVEFETPSSLRENLMAAGFSRITTHGAMFAPLRILHKISPRVGAAASRMTMPHEARLSDYGPFRPFAAHLIVIARR